MIAFRLNEQFLPRRHGFPARALLAGMYAMNSVKWLERIVVLGPQDWPEAFYASGMDLLYLRTFNEPVASNGTHRVSDVLIKSQIVSPVPGARLAAGLHPIWGFAWAGKLTIQSVQVSIDGGKRWHDAERQGSSKPFGWVRWHFPWKASRGEYALMSRAQDSVGNWQPLARDANRRDGYELNWCAPVFCSVR
jgi:DMSO/TMAO reductase YedYZ molybdopterin-dependent catalytic subunit